MKYTYVLAAALTTMACNTSQPKEDNNMVHLITLAPGHFHAALVQKSMYPGIDSVVKVFAADGPELKAHLSLIEQYNTRSENPTHWKEEVYTGSDFLQKMTEQQKGSVVVLAGNNQQKTDYISAAVNAGMHVLADKPMVISEEGFKKLEQIFPAAAEKKVLVYDIMTERSEITNKLQKELLHQASVFGELEKGTPEAPAVEIESIHHFYKSVSGKTLKRPSWFFDPSQQGDAIVDVNTHLVDLAQWICFDTTVIDYRQDIHISKGEKWRTPLTLSQFSAITGETAFPTFLKGFVKQDSILDVPANGSIFYSLKGVHVRATALWNYQAPEGGGDSHYAIVRGTKASLVINQGKEENWKPELYIEPKTNETAYTQNLQAVVQQLSGKYPGISLENKGGRWKVVIPDTLKTGHEAHFADVMQRYLQFLKEGKVPEWEIKNILAKYYVTTAGLAVAKEK
ncbi:oxidoreductase [Chitinophaga lutea]|uniref:Oxidoreductase n=1 Tax=Chitinophaga lutea TaxID=2488634 RepID=A0A3N4Q346_9BACT|nr:putative oxidoreductase C-terminal domain-containing protein [Chitinophaga lutea]RPE13629.1 oxidoreductase [Chitinophaga lutea]